MLFVIVKEKKKIGIHKLFTQSRIFRLADLSLSKPYPQLLYVYPSFAIKEGYPRDMSHTSRHSAASSSVVDSEASRWHEPQSTSSIVMLTSDSRVVFHALCVKGHHDSPTMYTVDIFFLFFIAY